MSSNRQVCNTCITGNTMLLTILSFLKFLINPINYHIQQLINISNYLQVDTLFKSEHMKAGCYCLSFVVLNKKVARSETSDFHFPPSRDCSKKKRTITI